MRYQGNPWRTAVLAVFVMALLPAFASAGSKILSVSGEGRGGGGYNTTITVEPAVLASGPGAQAACGTATVTCTITFPSGRIATRDALVACLNADPGFTGAGYTAMADPHGPCFEITCPSGNLDVTSITYSVPPVLRSQEIMVGACVPVFPGKRGVVLLGLGLLATGLVFLRSRRQAGSREAAA